MIDFTDCRVLKKSYNGANGNKLCIEYNGEKYMLKFPSLPTKNTDLSYSNGCISEFIACHIYDMLGIPVQETILGLYHKGDKNKIVVACKDFTFPNLVLQDFGSVKNQVIDSAHNGYGTELSDVLNAIEEQQVMDAQTIKERFWDMFVVDALLGNFDRHNGNWGFLYNAETDEIELAPVYDCGSCLLPQADEETIKKILSSQGEMNTRIYNFPNSAIKQNDRKINYHEFLTTTDDKDCLDSIKRIYEHIDMNKIKTFINGNECVTALQKEFYNRYIQARYDLILTPALERAKTMGNSTKDANLSPKSFIEQLTETCEERKRGEER